MTYRAALEHDELMGGSRDGWTLRVTFKTSPIAFGELTGLNWVETQDGMFPSHYLTSADIAHGSIVDFVTAIMDAGWLKGVRPTVLASHDKVREDRVIESLKAHIETLERQVQMQDSTIQRLLGGMRDSPYSWRQEQFHKQFHKALSNGGKTDIPPG